MLKQESFTTKRRYQRQQIMYQGGWDMHLVGNPSLYKMTTQRLIRVIFLGHNRIGSFQIEFYEFFIRKIHSHESLPRITRTNPSQAMCVPHSYKVHLHKMSWPLIYLQKASPFQLPWWGRAPHFVATNCWCTAKVLQNAIPRRHVYYKMTDTAAQKKIQVHVENYVNFFDPFCRNTYSHLFNLHDAKKKRCFFGILW